MAEAKSKYMFYTGSTHVLKLLASGQYDEVGQASSGISKSIDFTEIQCMEEDKLIDSEISFAKPIPPLLENYLIPTSTSEVQNYFFVKTACIKNYMSQVSEIKSNSSIDDILADDITNISFESIDGYEEIDNLKWFSQYFSKTFKYVQHKKINTTDIHIDYLQKNLLLDFKQPDNAFYTVKISPVRAVKCSYKDDGKNEKRIYELVGAHKFNEAIMKLAAKKIFNLESSAKIIGYIVEVFTLKDDRVMVPASPAEMAEILSTIDVSADEFIKNGEIDLNISSTEVGLGRYIYLMRESHSVSLFNSTKRESLFPMYCRAAQKYYKNLLQSEDYVDINLSEYEQNYISTIHHLDFVRYGNYNYLDRVGIYMPTMLKKDESRRFIETEEYILTSADSQIIFNEELVMNYTVGGFLPMFAYDLKNIHKDPYQRQKMVVINNILKINTDTSGKFEKTHVLNREYIEALIFTFSNECIVTANYGRLTEVKYNPSGRIVKRARKHTKVANIDLDMLDSADIGTSIDTQENIPICNISVNYSVADTIRTINNENWYLNENPNPLPVEVLKIKC